MNIVGLDSLIYGVDDVEAAVRFHRDWGLEVLESGDAGAVFALADGTSVVIRRADDAALPPPRIIWAHLGPSTVREVVWGVDGPATLDAVAGELAADREVRSDADGTVHATDHLGAAIAFRTSRRSAETLDLPATNTVGSNPRRNRPADGALRQPARPRRFGHVVYWAPGDVAAAATFYIDRLGFRITDRVGEGGIFLRSAGTTDHHNVLLQREGDYLGFQHVAYEFRDFDEVMQLGAAMEAQGWRTNVGPLRHNIGSSLSWYIWNPAGGLAEAYCDMDSADDDWQVRTFDPRDPSFYGHSWIARPEQAGRRPADLHDD
jgi:catechol 2,3-dioxygenase-like lactoylglutathione lyase family enzyme